MVDLIYVYLYLYIYMYIYIYIYMSLRYALGVVEAIATTIFIGIACDYCVHVCSVAANVQGTGGRGYRVQGTGVHVCSVAANVRAHGHRPRECMGESTRNGEDPASSAAAAAMAQLLGHAGPSLYGAALTTVAAAAPLLVCDVLIFRQMGEFIMVVTVLSLLISLSLVAPWLHILQTCSHRHSRVRLRWIRHSPTPRQPMAPTAFASTSSTESVEHPWGPPSSPQAGASQSVDSASRASTSESVSGIHSERNSRVSAAI